MDAATRKTLNDLHNSDANTRYEAFTTIMQLTQEPVDWAYEAWDEILIKLADKDNHWRAIAAQLLCNLAKSDPDGRMLTCLDKIIIVTKDEKFVTARHSLMSLWKVGVVNKQLQQMVTERLAKRFKECTAEKNCTLIRYDIIEVFRKMYDKMQDEAIKKEALGLIETEEDLKYKKKYITLWKGIK